MTRYAVQVEWLDDIPLAVIRRQVSRMELARVVPGCCGLVWNAVRAQQARGGRHVALYLDGSTESKWAWSFWARSSRTATSCARRHRTGRSRRRHISARMAASAPRMMRCDNGAPRTIGVLQARTGRFTATGCRSGMPIRHRSARPTLWFGPTSRASCAISTRARR
jgi:hypothetical protein